MTKSARFRYSQVACAARRGVVTTQKTTNQTSLYLSLPLSLSPQLHASCADALWGQSTWARAVLALLLTLAQLAARVWADSLYACDYLQMGLSDDLIKLGYTMQVMHQSHARHPGGQSACGACDCATCPRHVGTAHSKLGRRCQAVKCLTDNQIIRGLQIVSCEDGRTDFFDAKYGQPGNPFVSVHAVRWTTKPSTFRIATWYKAPDCYIQGVGWGLSPVLLLPPLDMCPDKNMLGQMCASRDGTA